METNRNFPLFNWQKLVSSPLLLQTTTNTCFQECIYHCCPCRLDKHSISLGWQVIHILKLQIKRHHLFLFIEEVSMTLLLTLLLYHILFYKHFDNSLVCFRHTTFWCWLVQCWHFYKAMLTWLYCMSNSTWYVSELTLKYTKDLFCLTCFYLHLTWVSFLSCLPGLLYC